MHNKEHYALATSTESIGTFLPVCKMKNGYCSYEICHGWQPIKDKMTVKKLNIAKVANDCCRHCSHRYIDKEHYCFVFSGL